MKKFINKKKSRIVNFTLRIPVAILEMIDEEIEEKNKNLFTSPSRTNG